MNDQSHEMLLELSTWLHPIGTARVMICGTWRPALRALGSGLPEETLDKREAVSGHRTQLSPSLVERTKDWQWVKGPEARMEQSKLQKHWRDVIGVRTGPEINEDCVGSLPPWLVSGERESKSKRERNWFCCLKWPELGEQMQSPVWCLSDNSSKMSLHVGAIWKIPETRLS